MVYPEANQSAPTTCTKLVMREFSIASFELCGGDVWQDLAEVVATPAARVIFQHFHTPPPAQTSEPAAAPQPVVVPKLALSGVKSATDSLESEGWRS